jgi:hypothetical protein
MWIEGFSRFPLKWIDLIKHDKGGAVAIAHPVYSTKSFGAQELSVPGLLIPPLAGLE